MLGQVHDRRAIGARGVVDAQRALAGQRVDGFDDDRPGIALLAVAADVAERKRRLGPVADGADLPRDGVEAARTAVQVVRAIVLGEREHMIVDGQLAARDAVAIAADQGAQKRPVVEIAGGLVEAEHDVGQPSRFVRHLQRHHRAAQREDPGPKSGRLLQRVKLDGVRDPWQRQGGPIDRHLT